MRGQVGAAEALRRRGGRGGFGWGCGPARVLLASAVAYGKEPSHNVRTSKQKLPPGSKTREKTGRRSGFGKERSAGPRFVLFISWRAKTTAPAALTLNAMIDCRSFCTSLGILLVHVVCVCLYIKDSSESGSRMRSRSPATRRCDRGNIPPSRGFRRFLAGPSK
jgi:hypothetical protein